MSTYASFFGTPGIIHTSSWSFPAFPKERKEGSYRRWNICLLISGFFFLIFYYYLLNPEIIKEYSKHNSCIIRFRNILSKDNGRGNRKRK
jgi:hypothetical protein